MKLRWTTPALNDLEQIGDYIARESSAASAQRMVGVILDAAATLVNFPQIGRPGRIPGTRELIIGGTAFIMPYRVRDTIVEILAVFHSSRRWPD